MTNDAFVAFWVGGLIGLIVGIALSGIMAAVVNSIERNDKK
jgi:predicted PurR-regulated permease PerM